MSEIGQPAFDIPGKKRKHDMNVQVLTDPHGRLPWASAVLSGAVHHIEDARIAALIQAPSPST